jgi:cyclopropane-fatty-acyl-phospholipid synthase
LSRSRRNVAHHYDLSDELFDLFLDADRQYSCAYFTSPGDTIERAQLAKKRHISAKLLLEPGMRVLDIGSGWGGLAIYLAQTSEVDVTGITLSERQFEVATERAKSAGVADRVRFRLCDYREVNEQFDRVVSVGMFEHVGIRHYEEYFESCRSLLADSGVALVHTIGRAFGPAATSAWIRRYIFPGGYSPALSEVVPVVERCGLHLTDIEILRLHYAETLKAWRERFLAHRREAAALYDERFCRIWDFYLAASEAVFRYGDHVVFQLQFSRRRDAVPTTRDYILAWERKAGGFEKVRAA